MKVFVVNRCRGLRVDRKLLAKVAGYVAGCYKVMAGQFEAVVLSDKEISALHKRYMGRPAVTDVICFDLTESKKDQRLDVSLALGGEVARRQAKAHKTSLNKELALYTVHGLLHCLGYDDNTDKKAERMHAREDELLTELGLGKIYGKKN